MQTTQLGQSDLLVTSICLGTMTFGEQVGEADAHAIMDRAIERGVNFLDTAEMYSVPPRKETFGATETIMGRWMAARRPGHLGGEHDLLAQAGTRAACPGCAKARG